MHVTLKVSTEMILPYGVLFTTSSSKSMLMSTSVSSCEIKISHLGFWKQGKNSAKRKWRTELVVNHVSISYCFKQDLWTYTHSYLLEIYHLISMPSKSSPFMKQVSLKPRHCGLLLSPPLSTCISLFISVCWYHSRPQPQGSIDATSVVKSGVSVIVSIWPSA